MKGLGAWSELPTPFFTTGVSGTREGRGWGRFLACLSEVLVPHKHGGEWVSMCVIAPGRLRQVGLECQVKVVAVAEEELVLLLQDCNCTRMAKRGDFL